MTTNKSTSRKLHAITAISIHTALCVFCDAAKTLYIQKKWEYYQCNLFPQVLLRTASFTQPHRYLVWTPTAHLPRKGNRGVSERLSPLANWRS